MSLFQWADGQSCRAENDSCAQTVPPVVGFARKLYGERVAFQKGYRVSDCGQIVTSPSGKVRALNFTDAGYFRFNVRTRNEKGPCNANVSVHRLQAYQKFGEQIYTDGLEVRHLDNNHRNNAASNIELGTKSQNAMDKTPETRRRVAGLANLKHNAAAIRQFYAESKSYKRTMLAFALTSKGTLHNILTR